MTYFLMLYLQYITTLWDWPFFMYTGEEHVRGPAVRRADGVGAAEPGAGGRGPLPPPLQHH